MAFWITCCTSAADSGVAADEDEGAGAPGPPLPPQAVRSQASKKAVALHASRRQHFLEFWPFVAIEECVSS